LDPRPYATRRIRYLFESGKFFYLSYAFRMFWWLLFQRVDVLLANDMDTLLPNFLVAKLRRKQLVYDSHEYWTEIPELLDRPGTRSVWLRLEQWMFPRVTAAMTVNDSIAGIYTSLYGLKVHSVRNLPFRSEPTAPGKPREKVVIYQGALNIGRGIEMMIEAMRFLPDYQLIVAGFGSIEDPLRKLAAARPFSSRIHFTGYVLPDALKAYTQKAMLGLSLEADKGASYHFALPNKLFDYIQAGVPVLVSDLPEMAAVVGDHGVGEVLQATERDPEQLALRIRGICENVDKYSGYAANCQQAAKVLNWENEKGKLKALFDALP
ncbi:MAG TPA: glycosyltransferase, partial [Bacteroidia bacterium]|nr:glycosyltransferase [Bacteroidia bacterium]